MARGRMFDRNLVCKDKFRQLSAGTQLLYFHLCMNADDEGFVDNTISLIESLPVNIEDLKTLIEKNYVMIMDDYLYVIKHWRLHNRIDKSHYTGTEYLEYLKKLYISENREYSLTTGTNLYEYQKNRGYLSKIIDDTFSETAQNVLEKNSDCTQNVLELSSDCTQKEPQLSKGKFNIVKENKVKVTTDNNIIRTFLDSHNLTSLDSRYEFKITEFFKANNKDESDLIPYLDYVFRYSMAYHPNETCGVDAKLFYANSLQEDVFQRFYANRSTKPNNHPTHWPDICPVCKQFHELNGKHEICTLDMSKPNSEEDIEKSRKQFEKYQESMSEMIHSFSANLKTSQAIGAI